MSAADRGPPTRPMLAKTPRAGPRRCRTPAGRNGHRTDPGTDRGYPVRVNTHIGACPASPCPMAMPTNDLTNLAHPGDWRASPALAGR